MTSELLSGGEEFVYGDNRYIGVEKWENTITHNNHGEKIKYRINRKPSQIKFLFKSGQYKTKKKEHQKSSVRAKVEHVFSVIKNLFAFRKTRYRGKRKQVAKLNFLFALANFYLADRRFGLSVWLCFALSRKNRDVFVPFAFLIHLAPSTLFYLYIRGVALNFPFLLVLKSLSILVTKVFWIFILILNYLTKTQNFASFIFLKKLKIVLFLNTEFLLKIFLLLLKHLKSFLKNTVLVLNAYLYALICLFLFSILNLIF